MTSGHVYVTHDGQPALSSKNKHIDVILVLYTFCMKHWKTITCNPLFVQESSTTALCNINIYTVYITYISGGIPNVSHPGEVMKAQHQELQHVSLTSKGTLKACALEALLGSLAHRA